MRSWPDHEVLLSRFREWLDDTKLAATEVVDEQQMEGTDAGKPVGIYELVEQLTAMRHEVKLLTKASRTGEERNEATLLSMQAAIEQFHSVQGKEAEVAENVARPLVEALIELDEALARGRRAIETARRGMLRNAKEQSEQMRSKLGELYQTQPWWRRTLCRPWHREADDLLQRAAAGDREVFDSLLAGYDLIQNRLRRAMIEQAIVRIDCVGELVDPHRMTVIETVTDLGRPAGTVAEEVRPGYCWRGKPIRFAEVKAVGDV